MAAHAWRRRTSRALTPVFLVSALGCARSTYRAPVVRAMAGQPTPTPAGIDDARDPPALRPLTLACLSGEPSKGPKVRVLVGALR